MNEEFCHEAMDVSSPILQYALRTIDWSTGPEGDGYVLLPEPNRRRERTILNELFYWVTYLSTTVSSEETSFNMAWLIELPDVVDASGGMPWRFLQRNSDTSVRFEQIRETLNLWSLTEQIDRFVLATAETPLGDGDGTARMYLASGRASYETEVQIHYGELRWDEIIEPSFLGFDSAKEFFHQTRR